MITFQVERWERVEPELKSHAVTQWMEMSTDQDKFRIDMNWGLYSSLYSEGRLLICTARDDGKLVGWHISIVGPHPHYQGVVFGLQDTYYVLPQYRSKPHIGISLFMEMEKASKERGCRKLIGNTKSYIDKSPLFERLDWKKEGLIYTKVL